MHYYYLPFSVAEFVFNKWWLFTNHSFLQGILEIFPFLATNNLAYINRFHTKVKDFIFILKMCNKRFLWENWKDSATFFLITSHNFPLTLNSRTCPPYMKQMGPWISVSEFGLIKFPISLHYWKQTKQGIVMVVSNLKSISGNLRRYDFVLSR